MLDSKIKTIDLEKNIDDNKSYICNDEIYEGLILKFSIEEKTCAACKNLKHLLEKDSICKKCEMGINFKMANFKEVQNEM
jgi:hypothetical protein